MKCMSFEYSGEKRFQEMFDKMCSRPEKYSEKHFLEIKKFTDNSGFILPTACQNLDAFIRHLLEVEYRKFLHLEENTNLMLGYFHDDS